MKLLFKQRFFSWLDSYDVFDPMGNTVFMVRGQLAWGHCLKIYDAAGRELGTVREKILSFLPRFQIYMGDTCVGEISRELTLFTPQYNVSFNGWHVDGTFFQWDYTVRGANGRLVATVSKVLFRLTDTYEIDVVDPRDALCALMFVLAVDAEKCSRG